MNTIPPPIEPPSFDKQMISYLRSVVSQRNPEGGEMPEWVPCRVRLPNEVHSEFWSGASLSVPAGDHDCQTNVWGAIMIRFESGNSLGIKPWECEILAFTWNRKRETVFREQAENFKSEISDLKSEPTEETTHDPVARFCLRCGALELQQERTEACPNP